MKVIERYTMTSLLMMLFIATACKTVPVTGRKQLNLVPNSMIQAMAFTEYDSVVKPVLPYHNMMKERR